MVLASAGAASASVIQDALQEALSAIQSNSTAAMAADMVDAASGLAMQASEKPAAVSAGAIALLALYLFLSWYYKPLFWMRKQEDVSAPGVSPTTPSLPHHPLLLALYLSLSFFLVPQKPTRAFFFFFPPVIQSDDSWACLGRFDAQ